MRSVRNCFRTSPFAHPDPPSEPSRARPPGTHACSADAHHPPRRSISFPLPLAPSGARSPDSRAKRDPQWRRSRAAAAPLFGGRTSFPCSRYSIGGGFSPPNPNPTAGPRTGPKIPPTPFHKGASPSSPAQPGELTRLAEVNASATIADRKPKPIAGTSCLRRRRDNASTPAYLATNSGYSMTSSYSLRNARRS